MSTNVRRGDPSVGIPQRARVSEQTSTPPSQPQVSTGRPRTESKTSVPGWDGRNTFEATGRTRSDAAGQVTAQAAARRPDLQRIQRDYQVEDDRTVAWTPKALGVVPVPFTGDPHTITATEAKMLDGLSQTRGLLGLNTFKGIRDQAFEASERLYPRPNPLPAHAPAGQAKQREWVNNDGHRDAFRHAYWNALLTREFGAEWTRQFATAHEGLPDNPADREAMDLYNNEVGRRVALENPNASPEQLATLVQQAVTQGRTVVIPQGGGLQWSDRVAPWQHGMTNNVPGVGGQARPDGNASAAQ